MKSQYPEMTESVANALDTVLEFVADDKGQLDNGGNHVDPEVRAYFRRAYAAAKIIDRWLDDLGSTVHNGRSHK
jgi:hypothetical protein